MRVKEGYKKTDLGTLPDEWVIQPCSAISELITVGVVVRPTQYYEREGIPALRSANIREAGIDDSNMVFISAKSNAALSKSQLRTGDVLTVRTGYPGTSAVVSQKYDGANCIDILLTRPSNKVSPLYLCAWINSSFGKSQVLRDQGGLAQQHFNVGDLRNLLVAIPAKVEQEGIASALYDADAHIKSLEQLLAKKRLIKQGAMQQLPTGKKRLPGFQNDLGFRKSEVGLIPSDWVIKPLPEVCRFRGGKAHEPYVSESGPFICVNSKFISTDGKIRKFCTANVCAARRNDILMVMSDLPNGKALAKAFLVDEDDLYAVNQRVCALTAYRDSPQFLFYMLNRHPYFLKFDDGVSQTHLLNRVFQKCPVALPPTLAEQDAIAGILLNLNEDLNALERKLAKVRKIRQGMIQELLTGRIRLK